MVITRTPYRISFFGGGTDYPAWSGKNGGAVLAAGISKYCYVTLRYLPPFFQHRYRVVYSRTECCTHPGEIRHPVAKAVCERFFRDRGVEIHHDGDLPARSGMGSSSSFAVGLLHAAHSMTGSSVSPMQLAQEAIHLEQEILRETVGSQDQVLASHGGLNFIRFKPGGGIQVRPVAIPGRRLKQFSSKLMLFFTGVMRTSSSIASQYVPDIEGKKAQLATYVPMAEDACGILENPDRPLCEFGELLHHAWETKKSLSTVISTPEIDRLYRLARRHGAVGGKLLGAGGGGFLLLYAEEEAQARIRAALDGVLEIPFEFEPLGSRVIFSDQKGDAGPSGHLSRERNLFLNEHRLSPSN